VVAILVLVALAAVALAAGGWAALEPRLADLLERRRAQSAAVARPAAVAPERRADVSPAVATPDDAPSAPPNGEEPAPELAAEAAPAPPPVAGDAEATAARDDAPAEGRAAGPDGPDAPASRLATAGPDGGAGPAGHDAAPEPAAAVGAPDAAAGPPPGDDALGTRPPAPEAGPPAPEAVAAIAPPVPTDLDAAPRRQDLQPDRTAARTAKRIRVQRGDTLMNLATREYGVANYTTLDVVRSANPGIQDVNRIIAGSEIVFPDPGPRARLVDARDGVSVLVATTPVLTQAQELQRVVGTRFRQPADLEPVVLGDGRSLYRVSLRRVGDRAQAMRIAEALGSILQDPS
jgi:phage tail protein X